MAEMNPVAVERELQRFMEQLEERTADLGRLSREAAQAEVDHKRADAEARVRMADDTSGPKMTVDERDARVFIQVADLYAARLLAAAARDHCHQSCRTIQAQLNANQSIGATLRELVTR